jgi:phosphohistidine phosphatase
MLRLYILRHAKSSWAEAGAKDFDRGLSERGTADLPKIAAMMRQRGYLPPRILCSPALRTRLTVHGIVNAYQTPPVIDYVDRLYTGGAEAYINSLIRMETADPVMVVGHNPSVGELADNLVAHGDPEVLARLEEKFPTGALAVIDFDIASWQELAPNGGRLVEFVVPREL